MESAPILNGEQPEAVLNSEIALNDAGCVARAHPSADPGLLNYRGLFLLQQSLLKFSMPKLTS